MIIIVVFGSAAVAVVATYIVRIRSDEKVHESNNEVAGFIFAAVGVIYGVLLAFLVLVAWQAYDEAQVTVEHEANALVDIYRLARELPDPFRTNMETAATQYAQDVISDEWVTMARGEPSPLAAADLEKIWDVHTALHAAKVVEPPHEESLVTAMEELGNQRRIRLLDARHELPLLLWLLLIGGGIVTIGFTLLLRNPNLRAHLLMAGMFAGLVAFVLVLIIELDNPFSGNVRIEPTAFEQSLSLFSELKSR